MYWSTQAVQQLPTQRTTRQRAEVHKQSNNYPHKVPHVNMLKYTSSPTTTHTKYHMSTCWSTQAVQQLPTQSTTRQCAEVHKQSSNPHKVPYVNGLKYTRSPTTTHTKYHMCVSVLKYTSSPTTTHTKYHTSTHWSTKSNNYPHTNVLKSNNRPHKVPFSPQCSVLATIVAILVYSAFFSPLFHFEKTIRLFRFYWFYWI